MKNKQVPINLLTGIVLVFCIGLFLFLLKQNIDIRKKLNDKNKEYGEAKRISKRLEELEKQTVDLRQKEELLEKRVPANEKHPFELMKKITKLGGEAGLRDIVFTIKEESSEESSPDAGGGKAGGRSQAGQPNAATGPNSIDIFLRFEGTFPQTISFLKKIAALERLVNIRGINIARKDNTVPYQEVSLVLAAYTFVK